MTDKPPHLWDGTDVADHIRRLEGFSDRLDKYSRGLPLDHVPPPRPDPRGIGWRFLVICALGFGLATFVLVLIAGEPSTHYEPPRGYGACLTKGC